MVVKKERIILLISHRYTKMPYNYSTKKVDGKTKYCMTSKKTGKTYCYDSLAKRRKGERLHEYFANKKK